MLESEHDNNVSESEENLPQYHFFQYDKNRDDGSVAC